MHHRSARPHQAAATSAPGQPARPRTLGTIRLRKGRGGSLGRGATRPASCRPLRLGPPCGWPAPPRWPRSCWRPTGEAARRQPACAATPAVVASIEQQPRSREYPLFQNRCWVSGPGVEFTGKGGEEPLSGEEGRPPPLECPAVRRPSAGQTWRDCGGIEDQVSPERWGRTMDGSRARRTRDRTRRAWYASWRQYRFARHYGFLSGTTTSAAARICSPSYAPRVGVLP